jgi:hypothetical protein
MCPSCALRLMVDEGMPTYHVSLDLRLPPGLDDAALDGVLRGAINTAACVALEVTPTALLVEADLPLIETLEAALRETLEERGGQLNSITFTPR